ncbi:MAG: EF-hand domain-containing protein [Candidatus Pacebacteria bacterium]|nr:EF-hand domain-containing protein [Candidatus Paceibacterota bacterium]
MLRYDPNQRYSAERALGHAWITKFAGKSASGGGLLESLSTLQDFRIHSMMQKAIMSYMSTHMINKQEESRLREVFGSLDKNGDGQISQSELLQGYLLMYNGDFSRAQAAVSAIMRRIDINKNGTIDYNGRSAILPVEFLSANMKESDYMNNENIKVVFDFFDAV